MLVSDKMSRLKRIFAGVAGVFALLGATLGVSMSVNGEANAVPESTADVCYFTNGIAGGYYAKNGWRTEAMSGITAGDTRELVWPAAGQAMDRRQKLWFSSTSYPLEYVNGTQIRAVDSVTSIDNGRGCQLNYNAGGYQIRHYVRALPGQRVISHIVEATNISGTTQQLNWSLGGDTWFSGDDYGYAGVSGMNPYVKKDANSGTMMYVPVGEGFNIRYSSQYYYSVIEWLASTSLPNNVVASESDRIDMGIGLYFNKPNIAPGQMVTVGVTTAVGQASGLQVMADAEKKISSGNSATHTFTIINLGSYSITVPVTATATNGWTATPAVSSINIPSGSQRTVDVTHLMPSTADLDNSNSVSNVTLNVGGYTGTSSSEILSPKINSITPTCRLSNRLDTTVSWAQPPAVTPTFTIKTSGYGVANGTLSNNNNNVSFALPDAAVKGTRQVSVGGTGFAFDRTLDINVPEWKKPQITARDAYSYTLAEGTALPDMTAITASTPTAQSCGGAIQLTAEGMPKGVSFTGGKFSGIPKETGNFLVSIKAKQANDSGTNATATRQVLLSINRPGEDIGETPVLPMEPITLNLGAGQKVDYTLPAGFTGFTGELPPGVSITNGKITGTALRPHVGIYQGEGKVGERPQQITIFVRDVTKPDILSDQPKLSLAPDGRIRVDVGIHAEDDVDGIVPVTISGLPAGAEFKDGTLTQIFNSEAASSEIRMYAYAKDKAGNETNGLYVVKLPLIKTEDGQLITGGRPEVVLLSPMTLKLGEPVDIPIQFIKSQVGSSIDQSNITGLPDGLRYENQHIVGTPTRVGTVTAKVTAHDTVGGDMSPSPRDLVIKVVDLAKPSITAPDTIRKPKGETFRETFTATLNATMSTGRLPKGLTFKDGVLSGDGKTPLGKYKVKVFAVASSGLSAYKDITIEIYDNIPPVVEAPENIITQESRGTVKIPVSVTDNIDKHPTLSTPTKGFTIVKGFVVGKAIPGKYDVEVVGRDEAGNEDRKIIKLTVLDDVKPVVTVVDKVSAKESDETITIPFTATDSFDKNPTVNLSANNGEWSIVGGNIVGTAIPGKHNLVLTARDTAGNETSATIEVTITDDIAPTITVQENNAFNQSEGTVSIPFTVIDSTDPNPSVTLTGSDVFKIENSKITGNAVPGTYELVLTAKDASGNTNRKTVKITVKDDVPPQLTGKLPDVLNVNEPPINATFVSDTEPINISTNIMPKGMSRDGLKISGKPTELGEHRIKFTVTDNAGNSTVIDHTMRFVDTTPPVISVENKRMFKQSDGAFTIPVTIKDNWDSAPQVTFASDGLSFDGKQITGMADGERHLSATITAVDSSGNQSEITVDVSVIDDVPPVVTGLENPPVYNINNPEFAATFNTDTPDTKIAYSGVPAGIVCDGLECRGSFKTPGTHTLSFTVTDKAGNVTKVERVLKVVDDTKPVISTFGKAIYNQSEGTPVIPVTIFDNYDRNLSPIVAGDCKWKKTSAAATMLYGNITCPSKTGKHDVSITVTDSSGNTQEKTFFITVRDDVPPVVSAPKSTEVETASPKFSFNWGLDEDGYAVGSAQLPQGFNIKHDGKTVTISGEEKRVGSYPVRFVVSDSAGNKTVVEAKITVVDRTPPVITYDENIVVKQSEVNGVVPVTVTDDTGNPNLKVSSNCESCILLGNGKNKRWEGKVKFPAAPGESTFTVLAEDASGNKAEKTITINVLDDVAPSVSGLKDRTVKAGDDVNITLTANEKVTWEAASLPDGLSFRDGKISGTAKESGKIEIIAKDAAGNKTEAFAMLTVNTVKKEETPVVSEKPEPTQQKTVLQKPKPSSNGNNVVIPGSPALPGEVEETTPVKPNEPDAQPEQTVAPSPKPLPPVNAGSSVSVGSPVNVSVLAKTGVAAVPAILLLSILMVVSGGVMLRRSRKSQSY